MGRRTVFMYGALELLLTFCQSWFSIRIIKTVLTGGMVPARLCPGKVITRQMAASNLFINGLVMVVFCCFKGGQPGLWAGGHTQTKNSEA